tara:strand:- start:4048 stop:5571 length:1524 start_codon:yes stop_codon:yes gene_type:complete
MIQDQDSKSPIFLSEEELAFAENLKDMRWRISNLYYIVNKHGKKVKFVPNWAQEKILDNLWYFNIILKARQLGITTFFCVLYLDQVLFNSHKTAGIIAHTDSDTKKIFKRIKFAWENLPEMLKEYIGKPTTDSVGEMQFPNGSSIFVARSTRGGTVQYLHISEFAKICAKYPEKAREIVTGAINSVEKGNYVSIESTAEGRTGFFFDYVMEAQQAEMENRDLSELDFKYFFFPWWEEATYTLDARFPITKEYEDYFENLRVKYEIELTNGQKRWYIAKKRGNSDDMYREYPSTWEEAFLAQITGAYYARQMQKVYEDSRIRNVPYDSRYQVNTYWDLGVNDFNVILFVQAVGNEIRIIDEYHNHGEGLGHYVTILKERGYVYGSHVFPHDVEVQNLDEKGLTRRQTLVELGVRNIRTVTRTKDINDDIEAVRKLFSRFYFDETKTAKLVEACQSYKKEWDEKLGQFKNKPKHDKHSHLVDPLRNLALTWSQNMISEDKSEVKVTSFF